MICYRSSEAKSETKAKVTSVSEAAGEISPKLSSYGKVWAFLSDSESVYKEDSALSHCEVLLEGSHIRETRRPTEEYDS